MSAPVPVQLDGKRVVLDFVDIFAPYRKQAEFLLNPSRNRMFLGGRGAGKSWALALDVLFQCLVNPGKPGLFLGRTEGELKQNLLPYFDQHIQTLREKTGIHLIRRHSPGDCMIELVNGSSFIYKGFENIAKVRMHSVSWVAMDEVEHSRVDFVTVLRAVKPTIRIAAPRQGLAVATSPNGLVGFTKLFYEHQLKKTPNWYVTRCPSWANPHLSQEDLDDWRESMSADDWRQEVEAIALRAKELVYHQFSVAKHLKPVDHRAIFAAGGHLVVGVDWGLNRATAIAIAVDLKGVWHVYDELTAEPASRGHWQEALDKFIKKQGKVPFLIAADRAVPHEVTTLRNTWGTLKTYVLVCDSKKDQEVMGGVAAVQSMLDPATGREPTLVFSNSLNRLDDRPTATIIPCLENYKFMKHLDGSLTDQPLKDDKYDHQNDGLRMAVVVGRRFEQLHGGRLPRNDKPDGWHADGPSSPWRAHL